MDRPIYLYLTQRLSDYEFDEYRSLCRKVADWDSKVRAWKVNPNKLASLSKEEVEEIALRLSELGVAGAKNLLLLNVQIPDVTFQFDGNFVRIRSRKHNPSELANLLHDKLSYYVRKFNPFARRFEHVEIRRYWVFEDNLTTFRGLVPRILEGFKCSPPTWGIVPKNQSSFTRGFQERDYQVKAVNSALKQIETCGCATIQAATGAGKTVMALRVWELLDRPKAFFLSLNSDLLLQAKSFWTRAGYTDLGLVMHGHREFDHNVVFATVQTLFKAIKTVEKVEEYNENGEDWISEWKSEGIILEEEKLKVEEARALVKAYHEASLVIFDEVQHVPARTCWTCSIDNPNSMRLGLSATPWRDDGRDLDIYSAVGDVCCRIWSSDLIERGYLVPAEIYFVHYHPVLTDVDPWAKNKWLAIKRAVFRDQYRCEMIAKLIKYSPKPALILVKEIAHGERQKKACQQAGLRTYFVSGLLSPKKREQLLNLGRAGKIDCIVATSLADETRLGRELYKQSKPLSANMKHPKPAITKEIGYIIGYVLADGYVYEQKNGGKIICLSSTNLELLESFTKLANSVGIKAHVPYINKRRYPKPNEYKTHICHTALAEIIDNFETYILPSNMEVKKWFLGGLIDGDGTVVYTEYKHPVKGRCHIFETRIINSNVRILSAIKRILNELSIPFRVQENPSGFVNAKRAKRVVIQGIGNNAKLFIFEPKVPIYHPEKRKKIDILYELVNWIVDRPNLASRARLAIPKDTCASGRREELDKGPSEDRKGCPSIQGQAKSDSVRHLGRVRLLQGACTEEGADLQDRT